MKKLFISLLSVITLIRIANSQSISTINQAGLSTIVTSGANAMANLFKLGDYKGYVSYIHPVIIKLAGGETKMVELLRNQKAQLQNKRIVINSIVFNPPSEIVKSGEDLQCTISQHTELKTTKGRVITYTILIAISTDKGKSWKFIDTSHMDITTVRKLFPNLSNKITLLPKQKPIVYPI